MLSANTCAGIANGRLGSINVPDKSEVILDHWGVLGARSCWYRDLDTWLLRTVWWSLDGGGSSGYECG